MKARQWQVQRQLLPCPEGQQRWDRVYQLLLSWTQANAQDQQTPNLSPIQNQEVHHASSPLCPRLRPAVRPKSKH
jgi:hypothetical protein